MSLPTDANPTYRYQIYNRGIGTVEEKRKAEGRELVVEKEEKGEERVREVEGEGQQRTTGGPAHQTARLRREDLPGRRGGEHGTGSAYAAGGLVRMGS